MGVIQKIMGANFYNFNGKAASFTAFPFLIWLYWRLCRVLIAMTQNIKVLYDKAVNQYAYGD